MDKISDFFKELKDRFSNPLFFSFLFAWFVFNWKIIIGLFFYTISELEKDGFTSYIDMINKSTNFQKSFYYPFTIALFYTFGFPIIRNYIGVFNAWIQKWGNEKVLKMSKDGKISVSKYIKLREIYEQRRLVVEDVLEKESGLVVENEQLKNEKLALQNQLADKENIFRKIKDNNDVSRILTGEWSVKIKGHEGITRIVINNIDVFRIVNNIREDKIFEIKNIAFNNLTLELIIVYDDLLVFPVQTRTDVLNVLSNSNLLRNKYGKGTITQLRREDLE